MSDLTPEQIESYLQNPNACPKCQSDDLESDGLQTDDDYAWANVECMGCGSNWVDVYTLTSISDFISG